MSKKERASILTLTLNFTLHFGLDVYRAILAQISCYAPSDVMASVSSEIIYRYYLACRGVVTFVYTCFVSIMYMTADSALAFRVDD